MPGPAETAAIALGVRHTVVRHGPVNSVAEAAAAQGVDVRDLVKTIVVRRAADDYVFVLVPGDRQISWPKLRALLGVNRLSLPDAATAKDATGYERGTITPFGSAKPWPVIADERTRGRTISLGGGERGVGLQVAADEAVTALGGSFADVTEKA
ncbi:aminoacyl-tRNA deacylase [Paractinoplanes globisporus]|uniref:Aminoacyl-tRNA deacylase n=1 Tax=Paractinoplanes globisporus TaxID=113565 RepID=A0ABW6WRY2_9ACTN|nr:YbaK/EbsC family protein [Actinoplanes globisporus]